MTDRGECDGVLSEAAYVKSRRQILLTFTIPEAAIEGLAIRMGDTWILGYPCLPAPAVPRTTP